jgi:cytochrome c oxidase subunit 2
MPLKHKWKETVMRDLMIALIGLAIVAGCTDNSGMAMPGTSSTWDPPAAQSHDSQAKAAIPADALTQELNMTAEKYKFTPSEIKVKQGTHLILHITSLDVEHGFAVKEYATDVTIPAKGTAQVDMYLDKAGTFPFVCSRFCGLGHGHMKGTLIVEPKE